MKNNRYLRGLPTWFEELCTSIGYAYVCGTIICMLFSLPEIFKSRKAKKDLEEDKENE